MIATKLTHNEISRFWHYVYPIPLGSTKCILFVGALDDSGYGQLNIRKRPVKAHRISWIIKHGPIPKGMCVMHQCDVRPCIKHLVLGTQTDNVKDMVKKNRSASGERHSHAKLTTSQAIQIHHLAASKSMKQIKIAKLFGIHQSQVSHIKTGVNWSKFIDAVPLSLPRRLAGSLGLQSSTRPR